MIEVTKDEFYAALYSDPRGIMPTIVNGKYPYLIEWRTTNGSRELFGKSGGDEDKYYLRETAS